jgi:hypothetical protein
LHNFKVVFGFREAGKDEDGGVDGEPYWDLLAAFAGDPTAYVMEAPRRLVELTGRTNQQLLAYVWINFLCRRNIRGAA